MADAIKPCPWCGNQGIIDQWVTYNNLKRWYVHCPEETCPVRPGSVSARLKREAIKIWNKRRRRPVRKGGDE